MAEIPRKNSSGVMLSSGTNTRHSPAQNRPLSVYSDVGHEVVGKQKQKENDEVHHGGIIPKHIHEGQQNQETQGVKRGEHSPEHSFPGSSACHGGPGEHFDGVKGNKESINKNKMVVRNLEDTEEYATRGDWWKGSLHY